MSNKVKLHESVLGNALDEPRKAGNYGRWGDDYLAGWSACINYIYESLGKPKDPIKLDR